MKRKSKSLFPWVDNDHKVKTPAGYKNSASFYASPPWRKLRRTRLANEPLCRDCNALNIIKPAEEVDHIEPISIHPELALDYDNTRSLCKTCHSKRSYEFLRNARKRKTGKIVNIKNSLYD